MIPFNKPFLSGKEFEYMRQALENGHISGNGPFTKRCHEFFQSRYGFKKCLLTTSCTDALEMCSILLDIKPGDEVIVPAFTFVSTANAFVLRGAKIIFADSYPHHPNIDHAQLEKLIGPKTKAIVVVHYAGVACEMDSIMALAQEYNLFVVEDAAQAIDSSYKGKPLGSIGHLAAFSFHETKNIISGEGGMLVVNDERFSKRSEIIWEKGTNRAAFFNGEVDKYGWVDIGSSFLPSDITAAFLLAQLECLDEIQMHRKRIWDCYHVELERLHAIELVQRPFIPAFAINNAHMYYLICNDQITRDKLIQFLRAKNIHAVFHYLPLHQSPYFGSKHEGNPLESSIRHAGTLVRLPFFVDLSRSMQQFVIDNIYRFFEEELLDSK